jgi:tripartite-type tricarboxylate transporter receptor subunit TctC
MELKRKLIDAIAAARRGVSGAPPRKLSSPLLCMLALGTIMSLQPAKAEDVFPSKPIRFIVPFAPGSITDVAARYYAKRLTTLGGKPVIVENRPGANGLIGVQAVLGSPADGYTVLVGTTSTLATNVALYKRLPYDPIVDLAPLTTMVGIPTIIVAPKDAPFKSLQDLVKAAKANPGKLNYAAGATSYHLMGELFNEVSSSATTHVPYKGSSEALRAAVGKEVDFSILDASTALGSIKGGAVRPLAIASERRLALLPDVPTVAEAGIADYIATTWVAAVVSSKTPKPVAARLGELLTSIANEKETHAFFAGIGAEMLATGPDALHSLQVNSINVWKRVATNAKIELQ